MPTGYNNFKGSMLIGYNNFKGRMLIGYDNFYTWYADWLK
jgi:hypothetical protein